MRILKNEAGVYNSLDSLISHVYDNELQNESDSVSDLNHSFTFDEHSAFENLILKQNNYIMNIIM